MNVLKDHARKELTTRRHKDFALKTQITVNLKNITVSQFQRTTFHSAIRYVMLTHSYIEAGMTLCIDTT